MGWATTAMDNWDSEASWLEKIRESSPWEKSPSSNMGEFMETAWDVTYFTGFFHGDFLGFCWWDWPATGRDQWDQ